MCQYYWAEFKATGNMPPIMRYKETPAKMAYENLEFGRFLKRHKLKDFKMNPHFPINSIMTMRAAMAAHSDGRLLEFVDAAMTGFWEGDHNMGDVQVFVSVMNKAGFDGEALVAAAHDQANKDALMANTNKAIEKGVFGAPTFFVARNIDDNNAIDDGKMFWGKERLAQVEEAALGG